MKSRKDIALALIKKEDVSNSYLHIFFQFVFQLIITPIPDYWGPVLGLMRFQQTVRNRQSAL